MSAAVLAFGAASALGIGSAAFDVGAAGARPRRVWSERVGGKPFGRVRELAAPRASRPRALLELGLGQVVEQLDAQQPAWRQLRLGVVIGTSSGGFAALERALAHPVDAFEACAYFSPLRAIDACLGRKPERLVSLYAACASSTLAIGLGLRWLELGEAELVIAGGYDAESDWVCAGFDSLKATSTDLPRPFRAERDGMALGEGVALLALGQTSTARAFVRGFAASTDAVHITAPDRTGQSLARAAEAALVDAQLAPANVDFVSVHGTGTSFNDAAEAAALRLVFGERAQELRVHAFKSVVGHTLGAAGALEALAALSAIEQSVLPASASAGTPMTELPAELFDQNVSSPVAHCLKLSTAFGGANAALVLSSSPGPTRARAGRPVYVQAVGAHVASLDVARVAPLLLAPLERLPRSDALSELCVAAAGELLHGLSADDAPLARRRIGVIVGSTSASLEANASFGARILARGREQAEPRRFPATSPNACAGHVAIAFGLGGPSHTVGAGPDAAFEAVQVAADWLRAGDAEAMLVVAAEHVGESAQRVLSAEGLTPPRSGAQALLLTTAPRGIPLAQTPEIADFSGLLAWARAAGLPGPEAFGSVRPSE